MVERKACTECGVEQSLDCFYAHPQTADRKQPICKSCDSVRSARYYRRNRDKLKARSADQYRENRQWVSVVAALRRYGLTLDQYHAMQERQDFVCAICGADDKPLSVDHDHQCCKGNGSGRNKLCGKCNRGLLCSTCNNGLGCFKDNPALLLAANRYLAA
jgi:hypothetical protein